MRTIKMTKLILFFVLSDLINWFWIFYNIVQHLQEHALDGLWLFAAIDGAK